MALSISVFVYHMYIRTMATRIFESFKDRFVTVVTGVF